jgi:hypothetical protein
VVTSGIEKPRKDEIIEIATKLGAKYRPHWYMYEFSNCLLL